MIILRYIQILWSSQNKKNNVSHKYARFAGILNYYVRQNNKAVWNTYASGHWTIIYFDCRLWPILLRALYQIVLANHLFRKIFREVWITIHIFSYLEMNLKMSCAKCRPCCLGHKLAKTCFPLKFPGYFVCHILCHDDVIKWKHFPR